MKDSHSFSKKQKNKEKNTKETLKRSTIENIEWNQYFQSNQNQENLNEKIDFLANQTIKEFWAYYDLMVPYEFEHKFEHTAKSMFYLKKAHYSMKLLDGKILHKYRGVNLSAQQMKPIYHQIAETILSSPEKTFQLPSLKIVEKKIQKIGSYLSTPKKENGVLPGYLKEEIYQFKLTDEDFPSVNLKHYLSQKKNSQDWAGEFLKEKFITFVLTQRIQHYKTSLEKFRKKKE